MAAQISRHVTMTKEQRKAYNKRESARKAGNVQEFEKWAEIYTRLLIEGVNKVSNWQLYNTNND